MNSKPRYQKTRRKPTKILSEATRRQRKKNGTGKEPACPVTSRETRSRTTYIPCRKVQQVSSHNHSSHVSDQQKRPRPRDPRSLKSQSEIPSQPRPNLQTTVWFPSRKPENEAKPNLSPFLKPRSRGRKKKWYLLGTCPPGASATYVHVPGPRRQAATPTLLHMPTTTSQGPRTDEISFVPSPPATQRQVPKSTIRHAGSVIHDAEVLASRITTTIPTDQAVSY